MKASSNQLFSITLLALLAGLTFVLQNAVDGDPAGNNGKARHDPDAIAENFEVRRFDTGGQLKYRLQAPYLEHFPDDDSSELRHPRLLAQRPNGEPLELRANYARASAGGETVYLWDDVIATRPGVNGQAPTVARMPNLTVQPDLGHGFTDSPVRIDQGTSWLQGVGMRLDNNAATFTLLSQVQGSHIRQRDPQ